MRIFKKILSITIAAIMVTGALCVGASAKTVESSSVAYDTYMYDYNGNPIITPHAYIPSSTFTGNDLGVGNFTEPQDIEVDSSGNVYIVDTGYDVAGVASGEVVSGEVSDSSTDESTSDVVEDTNAKIGRLVVLNPDYSVKFVIATFDNNGKEDSFNHPEGVTIAPDNTIYVADTQNQRIVRFTPGGKFIKTYDSPVNMEDSQLKSLMDSDYVYRPKKLAVDQSENIFVVAQSVNMGILLLDRDGEFSGFVGAQKVSYNVVDYIWKTMLSKEQQSQMQSFVPTEYNNIRIDEKGFVYATTSSINADEITSTISSRSKDSKYSPVKRLNPTGNDVLVRSGYHSTVGDISFKYNSLGQAQVSIIADVALSPSGRYTIMDTRKNRLFTYSVDGELLYAFSGKGNQTGNSVTPVSIAYKDEDLLLLDADAKGSSFTVFSITNYGTLIDEAYDCYSRFEYDESVQYWEQVLNENANFDIAYDGIGNAQIRTEDYIDAVKSFKYSNNQTRYSVALGEYRNQLIEKYLVWFVLIFVAIMFLLVKLFKWIGKRNRDDKYKDKREGFLNSFLYEFYIMLHPFDGFWDLKHEKRGSAPAATLIIGLLALVNICSKLFTNYLFNGSYGTQISPIKEISMVVLPLLLWVLANWCVTTLANGEGSMKDIYKFTGYALMPMVLMTVLNICLSHIFILDEAMYITFFSSLGVVWTGILLFVGNTVTHRYTVASSLGSILLSGVGMAIIVFIALLIITTYQRIYNFIDSIIIELTYRM